MRFLVKQIESDDLRDALNALEYCLDRLALHAEYDKYDDDSENQADKAAIHDAETVLAKYYNTFNKGSNAL